MSYDYSKLKGKIKEVYGTQAAFAEAMNMAQTSLSFKLNNASEWSQEEMETAMELLSIPRTSVRTYFFTHSVQKTKHEVLHSAGSRRNSEHIRMDCLEIWARGKT